MMFIFLMTVASCQASSSPRPRLLVVSGTNNQTHQDKVYHRDFDGVYEAVEDARDFYRGQDNVTVYMRRGTSDGGDVHIVIPTDIEEAKSVKYWFLPLAAMAILEKFGFADKKRRAWLMKKGKREELGEGNDTHIVWMSRLSDPEDKFDPDVPPINGWTQFLRPDTDRREICQEITPQNEELHKRIRVSIVRAQITSTRLSTLYDKKGTDQVTKDFILCTGQKNERLFLSRRAEDEDPWFCGGRNDCKPGNPVDNQENEEESMPNGTGETAIDELYCPFFVSTSIVIPICSASVMMALGFLLYMAHKLMQKEAKEMSQKEPSEVTPVEEKVNAIIQAMNEGGDIPEDAYEAVHKCDGGIELLFGCTFAFPRHPEKWHQMAKLIRAQEEKIHENNHREWMGCVRRKAKSKRATSFYRSLKSPNYLKIGFFHVREAVFWLLNPTTSDEQSRCHNMYRSLIPIIKATIYLLDFIKDGCLFLFLFNRLKFIYSHAILLKGLIVCHGLSIFLSSCVVGWAIQISGTIVNLEGVESATYKKLLQIFFFLITPLIPVAIIYKAISFSIEKQRLKSKWRKSKDVGVTSLWHSYDLVHKKNRDLMVAYSDLKMVEANLQSVPQIYFLSVFFLASWLLPETTLLGLTSSPKITFGEGAFLFLSLGHSYTTTILSIFSAMDIRKDSKMTIASKVLLPLSVTFQILGRLWPMVVTSMLAIVDIPPLSASQALLLLLLPVVTHWIFLHHLYSRLSVTGPTSYWRLETHQRILHLISNTWVTLPVRETNQKNQVHKGKEQFWSLLMVAANIAVTAIITVFAMEVGEDTLGGPSKDLASLLECSTNTVGKTGALRWWFKNLDRVQYSLGVALPSLILHFLGCALLLLHYRCSHPWRKLPADTCFGQLTNPMEPLEGETPYWENENSWQPRSRELGVIRPKTIRKP